MLYNPTQSIESKHSPKISISSSGLITATCDNVSTTMQLTKQDAATITPGTSAQTAVAAGRYTTGAVKVAGDTNLIAGNIKSGVSIFGVAGTMAASLGAIKYNDMEYVEPDAPWYTTLSTSVPSGVEASNVVGFIWSLMGTYTLTNLRTYVTNTSSSARYTVPAGSAFVTTSGQTAGFAVYDKTANAYVQIGTGYRVTVSSSKITFAVPNLSGFTFLKDQTYTVLVYYHT